MRVINEVINMNDNRSPCSWIKLRCYWERPEERLGGGGEPLENMIGNKDTTLGTEKKEKNPPNPKTQETEKKKN
jgi:hypothetical protein